MTNVGNFFLIDYVLRSYFLVFNKKEWKTQRVHRFAIEFDNLYCKLLKTNIIT